MRINREKILNENGGVAILVAIGLTALLSVTAFVLDIGAAYAETASAQNAADAAAYAAGALLPVEVSNAAKQQLIIDTAVSFAEKNGYEALAEDNILLGGVTAGKYTSLTVSIPASAPLQFGGITGSDTLEVTRSATVQLSTIKEVTDAVPLGIQGTVLNTAIANGNTSHIVLKYSGGGGTEGFFGALDLDGLQGGGARDFTTWLALGYGDELHVGDVLPVESGNMAGPTNEGLQTRLGRCTHYTGQGGCIPSRFVEDCPRVVKVIVYEPYANKSVKIVGFAAFVLENTNASGEVIGSYVTITKHTGETANVGSFGMNVIKLSN